MKHKLEGRTLVRAFVDNVSIEGGISSEADDTDDCKSRLAKSNPFFVLADTYRAKSFPGLVRTRIA